MSPHVTKVVDRLQRCAALLSCGCAIALATPAPARAAQPALEMREVAPGNFVHYGSLDERTRENQGDQANIGFIVGERCVAVIDTGGSFKVGERLRTALRARTELPICYIVLTHVHPDHIFGSAAFEADKAQIVGHKNLPKAMDARGRFYLKALERDLGELAAGSTVIAPRLLVEDRMTLDLGGRRLTLQAWPLAHTDGDLTVLDEKTSTLWTGDLLFLEHTPVVDGSIVGFLEVTDRLAQMSVAHVVPGHGHATQPWPQPLAPERRYLNVVLTETRAALKARKPIQDAVDVVGNAEAPNWVNFEAFHRRNVTAAYTELEWED